MLTSLYIWWAAQMRDCIPASLRPPGRLWRRALVIAINPADAARIELFLQTTAVTPLGQCDLGDGAGTLATLLPASARRLPVVIQLPADLLLERDITLPLAAERALRQVLTYEMDRFTPFRAEEIVWTAQVEKRDPARNQLRARVALVARARIQPVLDALRQAKLAPSWLRIGDAGAGSRIIPLIEDQARQGRFGLRAAPYALAGCGVLAAAAVALPFVLQSITLADLDSRIEAMRPQVAQAERLRQKIAGDATALDAVAAARQAVGNPLQVLALLTEVLADDTYLTSISWRQRKLTAAGRSGAAARVIAAMAANPAIRDPTFTAPVTRDETGGKEMFSIRAEVGS
jgi:general secretion pathway protein L